MQGGKVVMRLPVTILYTWYGRRNCIEIMLRLKADAPWLPAMAGASGTFLCQLSGFRAIYCSG